MEFDRKYIVILLCFWRFSLNIIIEITKIIDINNLFRNNYEEGINYIWNTP